MVRKGAPAPGSVANYYKNKPVYTPKPAALDVMFKNAQVRASSTRWLIMTDTSACQVGVYNGTLGKQVSHGCVRLDINNAKWLYDNIPNGTKVVIY